jgi:filamentous hemagglutinin family protein
MKNSSLTSSHWRVCNGSGKLVAYLLCLCVVQPSWAQQAPTSTQLPVGGRVVAGQASIQQNAANLSVTQTTNRGVIDWASFNLGNKATVNFVQPSASSVTLNRVLDANPSQIYGRITANGQVFLSNPSGIFFSPSSSVDVGGLVATTLGMGATEFMNGSQSWKSSNGLGLVLNQGLLNATDGGYIGLLGLQVRNQGVVVARLGTVALASGNAMTLQFSDRSLVKVQIDEGAINSLVANNNLIKADGGMVLMSAKAANAFSESLIQNTGTIQAQTVENKAGRIFLLGDMASGKLSVDGTLDASAPQQGDGGFIETSAANVKVANQTVVTTKSAQGKTGKWLIDPTDFTVAASGGDQTGAQLSSALQNTDVELQSASGAQGTSGNVNINDAVSWSAPSKLTLTASNNVNINANILASDQNAGLVINPNTTHQSGLVSQTASGSGVFNLGSGVSIGLPNVSASSQTALVIAGVPYTVINSLGAVGSVTGLDLQGINGNLSGNYALGQSIDASATSAWNSGAGFQPIGLSTYFSGKIYGLGNTISNLYINRPLEDKVGLLGGLSVSAIVRDLKISSFSYVGNQYVGGIAGDTSSSGVTYSQVMNSYADGALVSNQNGRFIGGLVGRNLGLIDNSDAAVSISINANSTYSDPNFASVGGLAGANSGANGVISNANSSGAITLGANWNSVGGLVGNTSSGSKILKSSSSVSITLGSTGIDVGGLVGNNNSSSIEQSFSTGNVVVGTSSRYVGGLVGSNWFSNTVLNSYATGSVNAGSGSHNVGGFAGINNSGSVISNSYSSGAVAAIGGTVMGGFVAANNGSINNSFWNTETTGISTSGSGGVINQQTGLTFAQMKDWSTFATAGWSSSVWFINPSVNTGFPVFTDRVLFARSIAGSSVYGSTPNISWAFYDATSGGNRAIGLQTSGTALSDILRNGTTYSGSDLQLGSYAGSYQITYKSGLSVIGGKYYLLPGQSENWQINPAPLTIAAVSSTKTYDATTSSSIAPTVSGLQGSDTVSGKAQAFDSKNAGARTLSVTGYTVNDGNSGGNYTVTTPTAAGTITPANLQVTVSANDKTYDATTAATLANNAAVTPITGDALSVGGNGVGVFGDKNVGTGKLVTVSGFTLSGNDASNYSVVQPTGVTANITPAALTVIAQTDSKIYDATTSSSIAPTVSGLQGSDTVSGKAQAFDSKNAGARTLSVTGYTVNDGNSGGNYTVITPTAAGMITPANLQVTGVGADNRTFDATTKATLNGSASVSPITGDVVLLAGPGAGQFSDKSVGVAKPVVVTGFTISGVDAANYNLLQPAGVTASIVATDERLVTQRPAFVPAPASVETSSVTRAAGGVPEVSIGVVKPSDLAGISLDFSGLLYANLPAHELITMTGIDGKTVPPGVSFDAPSHRLTLSAASLQKPIKLVFKDADRVFVASVFLK